MTNHVHAWAIMEDTSREPAFLLCLCGEIRAVAKEPLGVCPILPPEREPEVLTWRWRVDWVAVAMCAAVIVAYAILYFGLIR